MVQRCLEQEVCIGRKKKKKKRNSNSRSTKFRKNGNDFWNMNMKKQWKKIKCKILTFFFSLFFILFSVILATALVHMLTPAFENLSNPCLPETFTEDYGAWPGAICLMSIVNKNTWKKMKNKILNKLCFFFFFRL